MKNIIKNLKNLLRNNGDVLYAPLMDQIFFNLLNDKSYTLVECNNFGSIYVEYIDKFGDMDSWEYSYTQDDTLKIYFRNSLIEAGIPANRATWLWYNDFDLAEEGDKLILLHKYIKLKQILKMATNSCPIGFVDVGVLFPQNRIKDHVFRIR